MNKTAIIIIWCAAGLLSSRLLAQNISFQRTYGGNYYSYCYSSLQLPDEGYLAAGSTSSFGTGSSDMYLIRTDSLGNLLWQKTYGGSVIDAAYNMIKTNDGGYLLSGYTSSFGSGGYDFFMVKTDSLGNTLWTKSFGGTGWDFAYTAVQTPDSGYVVAGQTYSFGNGNADLYVLRLDYKGDTLWTKTYGGSMEEGCKSSLLTSDSCVVIAGYTTSNGDSLGDIFLLKINMNGDTLWSKTIGTPGEDRVNDIQSLGASGFILAGYTNGIGAGQHDFYLVRTDVNGDTLWSISQGGPHDDEATSIRQDPSGDLIFIGPSSFGWDTTGQKKDIYLFRADANGYYKSGRTIGGLGNDYGNSLLLTSDGGFFVAGNTNSFGQGLSNIYLVKLDFSMYMPDSVIIGLKYPALTEKNKIFIYPNPFSASAVLSLPDENFTGNTCLDIYDACGKKVEEQPLDFSVNGNYCQAIIERKNLPPGTYLYRINDRKNPVAGIMMVK